MSSRDQAATGTSVPSPDNQAEPETGSENGSRPVASWLGRRFDVEVGPVAHGGHCVARHEG
ncbi:MAG: hypothetical protein M3R66_06100, partial [Actinomycetota bacterium]|nr:hypothetical protein [Actinomycetota bacterium]